MKLFKGETPLLALICLVVLAEPCCLASKAYASARHGRKNTGVVRPKAEKSGTIPERLGLENIVHFAAKDSVIYNLQGRTMELWGKARLNHENTTVTAPEITIDLETELLQAKGAGDSSGKSPGKAEFSDLNGSFRADRISYDFKTGRGETSTVESTTKGIIFSGKKVERLENGRMEIYDGMFTTCEEADPHYWFSSSHLTIIPDSRIIARPFVMHVKPEVFSRRLPALPLLALPYMVFPIRDGRSSGFLIPHLGHDDRGFYLSRIGYYWAISDYMDDRAEGDISLNGSWRLGDRFRYARAGAFKGQLSGEYKSYYIDDDSQWYRSWTVNFLHNQEFDPTARLDINLDLQGGKRHYDLNSMNPLDIVNQQSISNISFAKTFNDDNALASLFYSRSENLVDSSSIQKFGAAYFQNRMYPFRNRPGSDWLKDFSLTGGASYIGNLSSEGGLSVYGYSANASLEAGYYREFSEGSKALFTQAFSLQRSRPDMNYYDDVYDGTTMMFPFRVQSTLFRHFNVNAGLLFSRFQHASDSSRDFSSTLFTLDAGTRLYATLDTGFLEKLTGLKAIRHVFIPTITYAWNPSFSAAATNYYRKLYDWTDPRFFNRFDNNIFAGLPEGQSSLGITLKNIIQGRFRGPESPVGGRQQGDHTRQLLSVTASTAYNFAAPKCPLEPITIVASSNALSDHLLLSAGGMYDYYSYDPATGERINRSSSADGKGLLRYVKGFLNMTMSIGGRRADGSISPAAATPLLPNAARSMYRERFNTIDFDSIDYSIPWELRVSLFLQSDKSNPLLPVQMNSQLNASAKASLSRNWQVELDSGYDFANDELVFPMVQVYRDLHCWQFGFQMVPFGEFRSFSFQIGLKAPQFSDIRFKASGTPRSW